LPATFVELRALGCRTLIFKGQDVSSLCFGAAEKNFMASWRSATGSMRRGRIARRGFSEEKRAAIWPRRGPMPKNVTCS
jgi:hypothetical protein